MVGGGNWRGLCAQHSGLETGRQGLRHQRRGGIPRRARIAEKRRRFGGFQRWNIAGGHAEILPRANQTAARGHADLRHRRQVSQQNVFRSMDDRQRIYSAQNIRGSARFNFQAPLGPRGLCVKSADADSASHQENAYV